MVSPTSEVLNGEIQDKAQSTYQTGKPAQVKHEKSTQTASRSSGGTTKHDRAAPSRSAVALPVARLPTPVAAKSGSVPTHERLGPDDCENDGEVTLAGVGSVMPGMGASCWRITAHIEFQASE
jgi:BRCT domain type II-containing protein